MNILGIDLGMTGALAVYDGKELLIWDMPVLDKEGGGHELDVHLLHRTIQEAKPDFSVVEKVTALPGISGKSAFSMGKSEGAVIAILASCLSPYILIRPAQWKKDMACPKDKDAARMRASQLLPGFAFNWERKRDDGRAEASLLALWGFERKQLH